MSDKPISGAGRPRMQWYPLFVNDFDLDTMSWPLEAVGALVRLMNYQWREGSLPLNQERLARIAGCANPELWRTIWLDYLLNKFTEISPGQLVNNRLHRERKRIEKKGKQARDAALKRWSDATSDTDAMRPHMRTKNKEQRTKKKDKISPTGSVAEGDAGVPMQKIVDLYHDILPNLPMVKVLSEKRKRALRTRWKTFKFTTKGETRTFDNLATWETYFRYIAERCKFLHGHNDRGWTADFDFVIRESAMVSTLEGKYADRRLL